MKKVVLLFGLSLVFTACLKEYTCQCKNDEGDTVSTDKFETEGDPESICNAENISSDSTLTCNHF